MHCDPTVNTLNTLNFEVRSKIVVFSIPFISTDFFIDKHVVLICRVMYLYSIFHSVAFITV